MIHPLQIEVERLSRGPLELDYEMTPAEFDLVDDPEFTFDQPVRGHLKARLAGPGNVLIEGTILTTVRVECVRCLHSLEIPINISFQTVFLPRPEDEERFEELQDDDKVYYDGDLLQPGEQMREEIMIALPLLPACEFESAADCPHGQEMMRLVEQSAGEDEVPEAQTESQAESWQAQIARVRRELKE